ncbi:hypothetical protein ACTWP5_02150 [Streptomyces sp. 4N509B]|uniref:hypothetical protein n=1 Tax=Streptomyces sp. 4N509B TaxID=3457413 RepID=UPI003FD4D4D0
MAGRRVSRLVEAREKARARTAERRRREQRLEDLATDWFQAEGEISEIEAAAERRIELYAAKVRGEAETSVRQLRGRMDDAVGEMLTLTGVRAVAELLGTQESTVRAVRVAADAAANVAPSAAPDVGSSEARTESPSVATASVPSPASAERAPTSAAG